MFWDQTCRFQTSRWYSNMEKNKLRKKNTKTQRGIKSAENLFSSLLEGIGDSVVFIDRDFRIISANSGYLGQAQYTLKQIIGKHCYEISRHPLKSCYEKDDACVVRLAFSTGERRKVIHTHLDRNGNLIYVETCAYPLRDRSGKIISAIETITDVTEKVMLEKKIRAVGVFSGGFAHDFNNILTGILSYTQLADMKTSDPYIKNALKQILNLGQRAADRINDLLLPGKNFPPE